MAVLFLAGGAPAQSDILRPGGKGDILKGDSAGAAKGPVDREVSVGISREDCRRLLAGRAAGGIMHQPSPGVAHQPGQDTDSRGRPVPPADLPGSAPDMLADPVVIDLQIPLQELTDRTLPSGIGQSEARLGRITIDPRTGQMMLNGKLLDPQGEDAVTAACRARLAGEKPAH